MSHTIQGRLLDLLSNYPADVVYVINGKPVTKSDILQGKRERQRRQLAAKRRNYEPLIRPCWIQVFWTNGISGVFYRGWWLYVNTLHAYWEIGVRRDSELVLKIMRVFPCSHLPMTINFDPWKESFASYYHRPTPKRPTKQGMAVAWAKVSTNRQLLDILDPHQRKQISVPMPLQRLPGG